MERRAKLLPLFHRITNTNMFLYIILFRIRSHTIFSKSKINLNQKGERNSFHGSKVPARCWFPPPPLPHIIMSRTLTYFFFSKQSRTIFFFFKKKRKGKRSSFLDSIVLRILTCFCISFYSAYALI